MKNTSVQHLAVIAVVAARLGVSQARAGVFFQAAKRAAVKRVGEPAAVARKALVVRAPGKPHADIFQRSLHVQAASHLARAQREGRPSVVHIDRAGASGRRRDATGSERLLRKPGPRAVQDVYPLGFVSGSAIVIPDWLLAFPVAASRSVLVQIDFFFVLPLVIALRFLPVQLSAFVALSGTLRGMLAATLANACRSFGRRLP